MPNYGYNTILFRLLQTTAAYKYNSFSTQMVAMLLKLY